jgi:hypothetical protein
MNKKYYDNKMLMQNVSEHLQALKEEGEKLYNSYKYDYKISLDDYGKQTKEIDNNIKILHTMQEIILNNFLHVQQELLNELLEIYKNKYINKRIGEKTKEKIQEEFNSYILNNYNIECYCYINTRYNYNDEEEIEISLSFKDMYYQYELKQEKIKYNKTTQEEYLYYYGKINYTNIEEIEEKAKTLRHNYDEAMEKIKELKREIEKIRGENNDNNKCCLKSTYINIKDI